MKFELVAKNGPVVLSRVEGREVSDSNVSIDDVNKIIEVEQLLERLLGHRFHINTVSKRG